MHFRFFLLLSSMGLVSFVQSQPGPAFDPEQSVRICAARKIAAFSQGAQHTRNYAAGETDIVYQEMHWEVDPAVIYIKGVITYHFKSKVPALSRFVLDLANTLQVQSVRRGNLGLTFIHSQDMLLTIDLPDTLDTGETDSLTVTYEGAPVSTGIGSFLKTFHNGHPAIETESVPYGVRDWWPGKQDLIDKVDSIDVYITTPPGQLAAGNGTLVSITEENGGLVHHWKHRHPIVSYLIAIAVTNYASYSSYLSLPNGDSLFFLNYVYPENLTLAQQETPATQAILDFYNEQFGLYPFADEKYGHAQFSSGGTEIQTMSFMGADALTFNVIAHELAHQWFGDNVTCGSYGDIWLNEGWAEYLEGLAIERLHPAEWNGWKVSKINSITSQPGGSCFVEDTSDASLIFDGRLSYNKGFYIAHMLRWLVGDSLFFKACYNYLHDPVHEAGFARTTGLQQHFESVSGLDLHEFFDDWYYGEGYPSYTIDWTQQQDSIILWVRQAQSHPSVDFFEMPIPVIAYRFGVIAEAVLDHTYQDQRFSFYVGNVTINQLLFDSDRWILSKNNKINHLTTAVSQPEEDLRFLLYPNPAVDRVQCKGETAVHSLELMDLQGHQRTIPVQYGFASLEDVSPGLYIARLRSEGGDMLAVQRLVIIH